MVAYRYGALPVSGSAPSRGSILQFGRISSYSLIAAGSGQAVYSRSWSRS